jgi:tRNA U38,U39,U40 pseudouridine synthase TruA
MNLQSKMWHMVDEIVRAILSGNRHVISRYALGSRYDCEEVRKAVASHIPQEIMTARIVDLEGENERLKDALQREKSYKQ